MLTRCHKRATDQAKHIFHRATTRHTQRPTVRRAWLRRRHASTCAGMRRYAPTCANTRRHASSRKPQPNFARNLTRSLFEIAHKRCNSNDANSMFEQATGELRATLLGNHSGISNERTHRLERARRSGGPGCGADTRQQESPQPNFARNLTRSLFEIAHKRCNSNDANSMFEQATGELRATLLGNHPDQRGGRTHRQAAPVTSRCTRYVALHPLRRATPVTSRYTRYVALHPIRRGALPTDRVHCLRIGCTA